MIDEGRTGKDMEERRRGVIEIRSQNFPGATKEHRENPLT
jgi:hypothetical protein